MRKVWFFFAAIMVTGCGGQQKSVTEESDESAYNNKELAEEETLVGENMTTVADSTDRYLMLSELSCDALADIRKAICTADTLKDVFFSLCETRDNDAYADVSRLLERTMQLNYNYHGLYEYAYEWACHDSVADYFLDFLRQSDKGISKMDSLRFQEVIDSMGIVLEPHAVGSQSEMSSVAFVDMTMASFKAIGCYKDLLALCGDREREKLYFRDYSEWVDFYVAIGRRHRGNYSMYPMLINGLGAELMRIRYGFLQEEIRLVKEGKTCQWDAKKNPVDWSLKDADLLQSWYARRMVWVEKHKTHPQAENIRRMTEKIACLTIKGIQEWLVEF